MHYLLTAEAMFDGRGANLVERPAILVEGASIARVTVEGDPSLPPNVETIDLPGHTLMPGLIDGHVHLVFDGGPDPVASLRTETDEHALLRMAIHAGSMLDAGITTARDLGDRTFLSLHVRDAIAEGLMPGPRLLCAGPPLTTTAGHCWYLGGEVDGEVAIRKGVRERVKRGVDCLKVMATGGGMTPGSNMLREQFSVAELTAMVDEAHRLEKTIAAHCHATVGIRLAVAAGVDTLEHCSFHGPSGTEFDEALAAEIARTGIWISPTIASTSRLLTPERLASMDDATRARVHMFISGRWDWMRAAREMGCKFIASTDCGIPNSPHNQLPASLAAWVEEGGFPAAEVLRAATGTIADALGIGGITGSLSPGLAADIIAVPGNPLVASGLLEKVDFVMKEGRIHRNAVPALIPVVA